MLRFRDFAGKLRKGLSGIQILRLRRALHIDGDAPLQPRQELLCFLAMALLQGRVLNTDDALSVLTLHAEDLLKEETQLIRILDGRYFQIGESARYLDLLTGDYLDRLALPPIETTSFDLRSLQARSRELTRGDHAPERDRRRTGDVPAEAE